MGGTTVTEGRQLEGVICDMNDGNLLRRLPEHKGNNTMGQVRPVAARVEMLYQKGQPKFVVVVADAVVGVVVVVGGGGGGAVVVVAVFVTVVACYGGYGYDNSLYV